jgi:heat shock protein HslJ
MKKYLWMIIVVLAGLSSFTGCLSANQDALRGTSWVLMEIDGADPIEGSMLTIEFIEGRISGTAGCNLFGGEYQLQGDQIELGSIHNTEMYCMEPEGIMDQESVFLDLLSSSTHYTVTTVELIIDDRDGSYLKFEPYQPAAGEGSSAEQVDTIQPDTAVDSGNGEAAPDLDPPWDFNPYQDDVTGIAIFIPEGWIVTGIVEGEYAVLQSYPEDKYIGGEAREEGDTKCDLNIQAPGLTAAQLIEGWKSSSMTTIVSEEPFPLNSGQVGTRYEIESMGQSISVVAELSGRAVVLTCFGDFSQVDDIAATLHD